MALERHVEDRRKTGRGHGAHTERTHEDHRERPRSVEVRDVVPPRDRDVEPKRVARHIQREDRQIQVVEPERIARPSPGDEIDDGEEHGEDERDPDVARPERFALETRIGRVDQRIDGEHDDRDAQSDVEQDAGIAQRRQDGVRLEARDVDQPA